MNPPLKHIGEFRLDQLIQTGPYTLAIKGYQPSLARPVFIKLLKPQAEQHDQWLARFRREARLSARLKHPNIVDVYTLGEHADYAYMAMAFVDGLSLRQIIEKHGRLSLEVSGQILQQILPALLFSHHEGIVHRDVKPGNLLVDRQGQVRVTDFGLAFSGQDMALTQQGAILGTPAYMAPEQITGETVTPATDIFSLGATFYELLTGTKAFNGDTYSACLQQILHKNPPPPSALQPGLPPEIDALVAAMLQKEPQERAALDDVLARLQDFLPKDVEKTRQQLAGIVNSLKPVEEKNEKPLATPRTAFKPKTSVQKNRKKSFILPVLLTVAVLFVLFLAKPFSKNQQAPEITGRDEQIANAESLVVVDKNEALIPTMLTDTTKSRHEVAAVRQQEKITIVPQKNEAENVPELEPPQTLSVEPATVHLDVEPWAHVSLDGSPVDSMKSHLEIEMQAGEHELVLSHPEFAPQVMNLSVAAGEHKQVRFSFLQHVGFLNIQVRPWAYVYLDGQYIEETPLRRPIVCAAGERVLELRNPNYASFRQVLHVVKGDTITIFHVMK